MKVFIFSVFFVCFVFTQAQEPTPGSSATEGSAVVTQCYDGEGFVNITQVDCDFAAGEACQTKTESRLGTGYFQVERVCTQLSSCLNRPQPDSAKCNGENGISECYSCCQSDLCNDFVSIGGILNIACITFESICDSL